MVELRQEKVNRIQNDIAQTEVYGDENGDVLILSWGGTCLLYTSPSPRDRSLSRMPSSA